MNLSSRRIPINLKNSLFYTSKGSDCGYQLTLEIWSQFTFEIISPWVIMPIYIIFCFHLVHIRITRHIYFHSYILLLIHGFILTSTLTLDYAELHFQLECTYTLKKNLRIDNTPLRSITDFTMNSSLNIWETWPK